MVARVFVALLLMAPGVLALDFVPYQGFLISLDEEAFSDSVPVYTPIGELFTANNTSLNVVALAAYLEIPGDSPESGVVQLFEGSVGGALIAVSAPTVFTSMNPGNGEMVEFYFSSSVALVPGTDYFYQSGSA